MSRNRCDVRCGFLFRAPKADAPTCVSKILTSPIEKLNSQLVGFILPGTHLGLAKMHVTHSEDERDPESEFKILGNFYFEQHGGESGDSQPLKAANKVLNRARLAN